VEAISQNVQRVPRIRFLPRFDPGGRCPECGGTRVKRNGTRGTENGRVQRYRCRDCLKALIRRPVERATKVTPMMIDAARELLDAGLSARGVAIEIGRRFGVPVTHVSVLNWFEKLEKQTEPETPPEPVLGLGTDHTCSFCRSGHHSSCPRKFICIHHDDCDEKNQSYICACKDPAPHDRLWIPRGATPEMTAATIREYRRRNPDPFADL
jgi:transposase-like protein